MKVIFLQDVPNLARAGDVKEVANGYGRNYLIPRKLALPATSESINAWAAKLESQARGQAQTEAEFIELASSLDGREIFIEARTGGKDRLYGSVTATDIATELEKSTGMVVDKRKFELKEPIHQLGSYKVDVRLAKDIVPIITVTITEKSTSK
jgi:large subunit ribosomal protein L9